MARRQQLLLAALGVYETYALTLALQLMAADSAHWWSTRLVERRSRSRTPLEEWFLAGAADGFNLMPDVFPSGVESFVDHVMPELRKRGIFRTEYTGTTLREHFGLARPENTHRAQRKAG